MSALLDAYSPWWLYLHEFALALEQPGTDEEDLKEAIALLVRDRLIIDGRLNEADFRFLEGRPDLQSMAWVNSLTVMDFAWAHSQIIVPIDSTKSKWERQNLTRLLIEIAASAVSLFHPPEGFARKEPRRVRVAPEQNKARDAVIAHYGKIPSPTEASTQQIFNKINVGRAETDVIKKGTIEHALGRRK
jgi:hypothetical protein